MEFMIITVVLLVMSPFIIFACHSGHLARSLADFISGKRAGAKEIKQLKDKLEYLESEILELRLKSASLEEAQDFSNRLLQDLKSNSGKEK